MPITPNRRKGKLYYVSTGASQADCGKSLELQLFLDMPSLKFIPDLNACKSGKIYVGDADNGEIHINLVPGWGGNDTFAASVTNDKSQEVFSVMPNADGDLFVEERFQEDFLPELDPRVNGNINNARKLHPTMNFMGVATRDESTFAAEPLGFSNKKMNGKFIHHRKLWEMNVDTSIIGAHVRVSWDCPRPYMKDTVCWKEASAKGSPCKKWQHIYKSFWCGMCYYDIPNLKCNTEYTVRIRKNYFNYITKVRKQLFFHLLLVFSKSFLCFVTFHPTDHQDWKMFIAIIAPHYAPRTNNFH